MAEREQYAEDDPRHHTIKIRGMLNDAIEHVREDVGKIEDPRGDRGRRSPRMPALALAPHGVASRKPNSALGRAPRSLSQ